MNKVLNVTLVISAEATQFFAAAMMTLLLGIFYNVVHVLPTWLFSRVASCVWTRFTALITVATAVPTHNVNIQQVSMNVDSAFFPHREIPWHFCFRARCLFAKLLHYSIRRQNNVRFIGGNIQPVMNTISYHLCIKQPSSGWYAVTSIDQSINQNLL